MARLRVTIQGELGRISAVSFLTIINKSLDVLQDLDRRISEERNGSVRWVVADLGRGSSFVTLEARPVRGDRDYGEPVLEYFTSGVEQMRVEAIRPPTLAWRMSQQFATLFGESR
jgi:hypothetical protein